MSLLAISYFSQKGRRTNSFLMRHRLNAPGALWAGFVRFSIIFYRNLVLITTPGKKIAVILNQFDFHFESVFWRSLNAYGQLNEIGTFHTLFWVTQMD